MGDWSASVSNCKGMTGHMLWTGHKAAIVCTAICSSTHCEDWQPCRLARYSVWAGAMVPCVARLITVLRLLMNITSSLRTRCKATWRCVDLGAQRVSQACGCLVGHTWTLRSRKQSLPPWPVPRALVYHRLKACRLMSYAGVCLEGMPGPGRRQWPCTWKVPHRHSCRARLRIVYPSLAFSNSSDMTCVGIC